MTKNTEIRLGDDLFQSMTKKYVDFMTGKKLSIQVANKVFTYWSVRASSGSGRNQVKEVGGEIVILEYMKI